MANVIASYADAFDIARHVVYYQRRKYRPGVERAAALAAVEAKPLGIEAQIEAIENAFKAHEDHSPRWDGSVG